MYDLALWGRRSSWTLEVSEGAASGQLSGSVACNVHYFEDGNVQLDDGTKFTQSIEALNARNGAGGKKEAMDISDGNGTVGGGPTQFQHIVHVLDVHLNAFHYLEENAKKLDVNLEKADRLLVSQPRRGEAAFGLY